MADHNLQNTNGLQGFDATQQQSGPSPCKSLVLPDIPGLVTWVWNIPANTVHFSKEWQHILNTEDDSVLGGSTASWWPSMHEDDVLPFLEMAKDIVERRTERYQSLFRVQKNDNSWAWFLSRGRVTEKTGSTPVLVAGALMEISELRADVKFRHGSASAGAQRGHPILENSPDLIVRMDQELSPLLKSSRIVRLMTGAAQENGPDGSGLSSHGMEEEQLAFLRDNVRHVFSEGVSVRKQITFPTAHGHDVTGEYSFWPEFDADGSIKSVLTQFRDLTEQVLADRRARLNKIRLDALYRLTQMGDAPEEKMLRFVMDSLEEITGSEYGFLFFPKNYPGNKGRMVWSKKHYPCLDKAFLPDDTYPDDLAAMTRDPQGRSLRTMNNGNSLHPVHLFFQGRLKVMRYISAPVRDDGKVVCIAGVCNKARDYTEADLQQLEAFISSAWLILRRHESIRELHRAKEAAEKANKVKDEFLANVSHELRTPLNGMLSMLQLIEDLALEGQIRDYLKTAIMSGQALMRIISDILDFSRLEFDKMQLQNEIFDFRNIIDSSVSLFLVEIEKKGLQLNIDIDDSIPVFLTGDSARVRQIIFNLMANALKFTDRGEIRLECSLLSLKDSGRVWVYLAVKDTGIGIPPDMQNRIFGAFNQIDSSKTRKYQGAGLGLSIVRHLVDRMGGSILVESDVDKGTTFHCSLAFSLPGEVPLPAHGESLDEPQALFPMDILVAEDDQASSFAMRIFLQKAGHRPVCVGNGRQALEALLLHPFHCIFTDIQMPDMDGLEVIRRIRQGRMQDIIPGDEVKTLIRGSIPGKYENRLPVPRDIPAVAVSAHVMSGDEERFLTAGMDYYLAKPVVMKDLQRLLNNIAAGLAAKPKQASPLS